MTTKTIDDEKIISQMACCPEDGFRLLMAKYKVPVYWYIRRLVVDHYDAEDVVQETCVRVFRSFEQFRGDCSLSSWIYRIATNEALRSLSRSSERPYSLDDDTVHVDRVMADEYVDYSDAEAVKLQKAILSLPMKQQTAFTLRYYDEMSYDDIAAVINCSPASAKVNYHIAKEKIIEYMNLND